MKELRRQLKELLQQAGADAEVLEAFSQENAVFPFSAESRILMYLMNAQAITYEQYQEIYESYMKRNQYLYLFEMVPRTFGETWGEQHILKLFPAFVKATKENMVSVYPDFDGEFDLWILEIRVEVKACRANDTKAGGSLVSRAYLHSEAIANGFKYHYQQLKPSCCDVFIWIGVCRDELIYWVLTSEELQRTGKLGSQHRNENTGIAGADVFEGQVFMTEEELRPFWVAEKDVLNVVKKKGR
jgi:hypothetical protein